MITVKIAYDPYHMKTSLNINGQNVKRNDSGYECINNYVKQDIPLQSWIDPIPFQKWNGLLWGVIGESKEETVEFHFRGRKIDFLDLKAAMEAQSSNGEYTVTVTFPEDKQVFCYDDQEILKRVKKAYELIHSDGFKQIIDDKLFEIGKDSDLYNAYQQLPKRFKDAMDGEFRIVFSGMYTCGKSTIINAILGKDILPTCDGTCTSKIFKIYHDPTVEFAKMGCLDADGKIVIEECEYDADSLRKKFEDIFPRKDNKPLASVPPTIETVRILTNMKTLYPGDAQYSSDDMKIVIIDTPGTDSGEGNALDGKQSHVAITEEVLSSESKEIVVMATNAKEDKNSSIQEFLDMVDKHSSNSSYDQRFLFVLNQADLCNFDKPSDLWDERFRGIRDYYNGKTQGEKKVQRSIQNPRFFPMSALAALEIRTNRTDGPKYRSIEQKYYIENRRTREYEKTVGEKNYHFDEVCSTSQVIKEEIAQKLSEIEKSNLGEFDKWPKEIELHSGIVSLEMAIRDYIERYAFPLKIQELLETYEIIFKETDQLLNIANSNFEKVLRAKTNADAKKNSEEVRRAETLREEKSLTEIKKYVSEKKTSLDKIIDDFEKESDKKNLVIKREMNTVIQKIELNAQKHSKDNNIRGEIQKSVDDALAKCRENIRECFSASQKKAKNLEQEIIDFFCNIQNIVDFGNDFHIDNTTMFCKIRTDSILKIKDKQHRNPDLDKGFFLFRPIMNLFRPDTINDGIDMQVLAEVLEQIRSEFYQDIDKAVKESVNRMEEASNHLKNNLDMLDGEIEEYKARLTSMKEKIMVIASDVDEQAELEKKLNKFKQYLKSIQNYTYFNELSEE